MTQWWVWIVQGRNDRGFSQAELAQLLGRSEQWVKELEVGQVDLGNESKDFVYHLANAVGVDRESLWHHV